MRHVSLVVNTSRLSYLSGILATSSWAEAVLAELQGSATSQTLKHVRRLLGTTANENGEITMIVHAKKLLTKLARIASTSSLVSLSDTFSFWQFRSLPTRTCRVSSSKNSCANTKCAAAE